MKLLGEPIAAEALLVEQPGGGGAVDAAGRRLAVEQARGVADDDRRRIGGPDHRAQHRALRLVQHGADGLGELAGLAAHLVEAEARAERFLRLISLRIAEIPFGKMS